MTSSPHPLLAAQRKLNGWHGALLIDKHAGVSSFGLIEELQRVLQAQFGVKRKDLPKLGHGGTLDPFATGLLIVCVGDGVKLARYFLHSNKVYDATLKFGETSASGDLTNPITEQCEHLPDSLDALNREAWHMETEPYWQVPPMHSAKKIDGQTLYELVRQGKEVEREPKLRTLRDFRFIDYFAPLAQFSVGCSSGTYIRTLAQDIARRLNSVGLLTALRRKRAGHFSIDRAMTMKDIGDAITLGKSLPELKCWIDFDSLLDGHPGVEVSAEEAHDLRCGRQGGLNHILSRATENSPSEAPRTDASLLMIRMQGTLVAVARRAAQGWTLERVFRCETD